MQVEEILAEGLKRKLRIGIPREAIDARLEAYFSDIQPKARVAGFRPGKVPRSTLQRLYGQKALEEILPELVTESMQKVLSERSERPAFHPQRVLESYDPAGILSGQAPLSYILSYEIFPSFELLDFKEIALERPVIEISEKEIDADVARFFQMQRAYASRPEGAPAEKGDQVVFHYDGRVGGVAYPQLKGENEAILGLGQLIPGFEEQLEGMRAGEERLISVRIPDSFDEEFLRGHEAVFEVTMREVKAPEPALCDDAFAQKFGLENKEALRNSFRKQIEKRQKQVIRELMKRDLFDRLNAYYSEAERNFPLPESLIETEMRQLREEISREIGNDEEKESEESSAQQAEEGGVKAHDEVSHKASSGENFPSPEKMQTLVERRVRVGLVLSEIGRKNQLSVTREEMMPALEQIATSLKKDKQDAVSFFKKNPALIERVRFSLFEEKLVDYIFELVQMTDLPLTAEELEARWAVDEEDLS